MGCNSHLSIEVFNFGNMWETWALDIPESRDYDLYEAMAGVRGDDANAVVLPRGVPLDISAATKYWIDRAGSDGHSHSWLFTVEFVKAIEKCRTEYKLARPWRALEKTLVALDSVYGENNVRLVFFFDS